MLSRRRFLHTGLAAGALALATSSRAADVALGQAMDASVPAGVAYDPAPFTLGVASGDPLPGSVILWTRIAPEPLRGGGAGEAPVEVAWVVAEDPRLRRVVASGTTTARADFGHSVHVDVTGLEPATVYFYAFTALGRRSRIGRTRTAPAPGSTDEVSFAFVSCQAFDAAHYAAYREVVRQRPDFVVHLGDYIYEGGGPDTSAERAHVGAEPFDLATYRTRYALYKGDVNLKAAHAAAPFVVTWDDHEVDNNYRGLHPQDENAAEGNDSPEAFSARRQAAYQAYYEHMPIRLPAGPAVGGDMQIYRSLTFGDVIDLSIIDTRQHSSDQPSTENPTVGGDARDPSRTILGEAQRAWLLDRLSSRSAAWSCIGNQVQVHPINVPAGLPDVVDDLIATIGVPLNGEPGLNGDSWDGFVADRERLLGHVAAEGIPDVVVITGDIHSHWVADLSTDFGDPTAPVVATEFVGTSVSSDGLPAGTNAAVRALLAPTNPHIRFVEGEQRGIALVRATPDRWRTTFRTVDDPQDPTSAMSTLAAWEVSRGQAGAVQVG
ncbi:alkaline phosphatase [Euzebya sp.]|uniref:alkaline phosphatase D family protein n=1 Tax=Euzebya sp. TaxID=1971409 RepID=UPI003516CB20